MKDGGVEVSAAAIMVPVLTLLDRYGKVDRGASVAYAQRARETWLDAFLLSGTIGLGGFLSAADRRETLEVWRATIPAERLVACAWDQAEVEEVSRAGVRPMAVLRGADDSAVLDVLRALPAEAYIYSHPQYTPAVLSSAVVAKARIEGTLGSGAKVSKVSLDDIRSLRSASGSEFALYDGRCRYVRASVDAGATGVVAVPLATLPTDLSSRKDLESLQATINRTQLILDSCESVTQQVEALTCILSASL